MEQLKPEKLDKQLLVSAIRSILQSCEELSKILGEMAREVTVSPGLDAAWIADARENVDKYRSGLAQASIAADAKLVSFWAGQLVDMQKYFSDQPLPSRLESQVRGRVLDIYQLAKIPAFQIRRNDPRSVQDAHDALGEFGAS